MKNSQYTHTQIVNSYLVYVWMRKCKFGLKNFVILCIFCKKALKFVQSDVCIVFAKREQSRLKVKAGFYERFYSYFDTQTVVKSIKTFVEERALTIVAHEQYS